MCTLGVFDGGSGEVKKTLEKQGAGADKHRPASTRTNGASRIRTENQGIMSPPMPVRKPLLNLPFTSNPSSGCSAGCSDVKTEEGTPDAELFAIVDAWPTLPEPIKAAIRALLGSVAG